MMFSEILLQLLEAHGADVVEAAFGKIFSLWKAGHALTREEIEEILDEYPLRYFESDDLLNDESKEDE